MPVTTLLAHAALLAQLAAPYPFAVGETLTYDATLGVFPIGTATATVSKLTRERGTEAFVLAAIGDGGPPGLRVRYELTSWVGTERFASLRFHRKAIQGSRVDEAAIPDRAGLRPLPEGGRQPGLGHAARRAGRAGVPLLPAYDPARGGEELFDRAATSETGYNPMQVRVAGRVDRQLYDGRTVPCLDVELTSRGSTMGVRFTDDKRRLPVDLDLPLPYGSVTLVLSGLQ